MQQVTLPDHLEEITIKDMLEGESNYTVPWAMWADEKGRLWLNGRYFFHKEDGGIGKTTRMKITRINGGFEVDISRCKNEKWASEENIAWNANRLPVVKLV